MPERRKKVVERLWLPALSAQAEQHFSYNRDKPVWRCWHCGEAGDWIAYLKKAKGLDFKECGAGAGPGWRASTSPGYDQARYREYAHKADILETAQSFFIQTLKQDIGRPVKDYLLNRGYSEADIDAMQVGAYTRQVLAAKEPQKSRVR